MRRKPSPVPGSDEWIALRRSGIGATDAAVVAGRSRFHGPFDKYAEMMGRTAPLAETEPMRWGIILQGPVGREWGVRAGKRVRANGHTYWLEEGIYSHYDFDVVGEPAILEVKTASAYAQREWGEQDTDQVPTEYLLQAQHEIMCRPGIERCYIAVLIGGQKLHKYVVERDDDLIGSMLTIDRKFLADTWAGIAPPIDGSAAATEYLRSLHPKDDGTVIELPPDTEDFALQYLAAKEEEKSVGARLTFLGNTLRERLEATAVATGKSVKVTYKATKDREQTDWPAVARELGLRLVGAGISPDVVSEHITKHTETKPGTRPLVVSWIGE
ncbi:MAG: YqaJ viral recombinase family protein [Vicinamibacterales bacterium]|jgi:putative phage-type endonuclease|nr:YqaJ viral recombinase family protein [Vicinamibacterales bacterium]MCU0477175.1 YqaJ viral recombinase family protein [Chloroflexota bacterium]MCU0562322.1 YqaJ viral recombinase family protein [Desulfobacterales bacterium]